MDAKTIVAVVLVAFIIGGFIFLQIKNRKKYFHIIFFNEFIFLTRLPFILRFYRNLDI